MKIAIRPAIKLPQIIIHRKVAAYCRVSTQQEIQHHNLEAQRYCAYTGRDSFASALCADRGSPPSSRRWQHSSALHLIIRVPPARSAK